MSLTIAGGPLASRRPERVNYEIDGPGHLLFFEPFPRRVRGYLAGELVLDTRDGMLLHESNLLPQLYVPYPDIRVSLAPSQHTTHCPFKGNAAYWSMQVAGRDAENAVWAYPEPMAAAGWLRGYAAVYWNALDAWYDEDEQVFGHLRDPYHRVDIRAASRHVRAVVGGEVLAESSRPTVLSETGLPNRYYLPPEDVRTDALRESATRTVCPYKGAASYCSAGAVEDVAWTYPEPLDGARAIAGYLCFAGDGVDLRVDGEPAN